MKNLKMKRGQIGIHETILVLFVFIMLLVIGIVFFYRFTIQSIENENFENERIKFESMITTFPQIPEIRCSFLGSEGSCIDSFKLLGFKNLVKVEEGYYFDQFGFKSITIRVLYPEENNVECEVSTISDCGKWSVYSEKPGEYDGVLVIKSPVSLYFPDEDSYGIGEMVLEWHV